MVKLMWDGFRSEKPSPEAILCWHVDARFSKGVEDIGGFRPLKALLVMLYCLQAVRLRFVHGITHFYYVPAPGMRLPVLRDWVVMILCRPFFKKFIFHWHSVGLGDWLETQAPPVFNRVSKILLGGVDLSIVLSRYNAADGAKFGPKKISVIANGIPDPCPHFDAAILPLRKKRCAARVRLAAGIPAADPEQEPLQQAAATIRVLFLALCTHDKGLFQAVDGVLTANELLRRKNSPFRFLLTVAGKFYTAQDESDLNGRLSLPGAKGAVTYIGFVSGDEKLDLLAAADVFCFPTFYPMEGQPVNLIEAMAFGLPVISTRWRSIPEMMPENYAGLVDVKSSEQVAQALLNVIEKEEASTMRNRFLSRHSLEHYLASLKAAIKEA